MKRFAALYRTLDRSTGTLDKRAALVAYFRAAPPLDAAWALYLLAGGKVASARMRIAASGELREWIAEAAGIADWLVADSYDHVGDLAETLALLLDDPASEAVDVSLAEWIEQRLLPIANQDVAVRKHCIVQAWRTLAFDERLVFNKLLTGALRVGVSQRLVQQALAELSGVDIARIAQRMLGSWRPHATYVADLLTHEALPGDRQQPYPFFWHRRWRPMSRAWAPSTTGCWNGSGMASGCSCCVVRVKRRCGRVAKNAWMAAFQRSSRLPWACQTAP